MIKKFPHWQHGLTVTRSLQQSARIWLPSAAIAACILGLRGVGVLQAWELSVLDTMLHLRPTEAIDERILIVTVREEDLKLHGWPISDRTLAELLQKIKAANPSAIGLDLYRDAPVRDGHAKLVNVYQTTPNLIGIQQLTDPDVEGVLPPPELEALKQVGFNNVIYDSDRKIRRALLYWFDKNKRMYRSFALKLALVHLNKFGIQETNVPNNNRVLKLGQAEFPRFQHDDGVYATADPGGYQFIVNYRGGAGHFRTVAMQEVLEGKVPASLLHNRIVLIGSFATSLKDFSATPYSSATRAPELMAGVEIQANFISEILSAAIDNRTQLRSWNEPTDWIWIWSWAIVGTTVSWKLRRPRRTFLAIAVIGSGLTGVCYGVLLLGWIVPLVPAVVALVLATTAVIAAIAHSEEELKRSKEFLHRIINSIPDPVFVKDKQHRWIVLNEAYARFLGKPIADLLEKSDYDVFPHHEADVFWQQDDLVFKYQHELEHEEEFTSINGMTYQIATKRSLHKDAAGNLFLVGVIRDITQRKTIEAKLRQTTVELSQSNAELRLSQDRLSYLANHDALTGLPNRVLLYQRLSQSLESAKASMQILAVLYLDLDGFKQVNDTLGHAIGDLLLQAVAKRLVGCLRTSDTVARIGGDEFVVLLPTIPDVMNVAQVARKILSTLSQSFAISGQTLTVTTSIGVCLFPDHASTTEDLIDKADMAMYHAKKSGKNQFAYVDRAIVERSEYQ